MTTRAKQVLTVAAADPSAPELLLVARLRIAHSAAVELLASGAVSVNGRRSHAASRFLPGDRVVVACMPADRGSETPRIIFLDDWLLVVDKPHGWLTQPSPTDARSLDAWLAPLHPSARLIHRIDKETSGLVLLSLRPEAQRPLQRLLAAGLMVRRYTAILDGTLRGQGEIDLRIARHPRDTTLRQWLPARAPGGLPARTSYQDAQPHGEGHSRVELRLHTGRTHQARLHLAGIGHPVVGDVAYGGSPGARLYLHARRLELAHPADGRLLAVDSPLPEGFAAAVVQPER